MLQRADFVAACGARDFGAVFRLVRKYGGIRFAESRGGPGGGVMNLPSASGLATAIVPVTVLVAVLITLTLPGPTKLLMVAYTRAPSAVTSRANGLAPVTMVADTALVAVSMTETEPLPLFAT